MSSLKGQDKKPVESFKERAAMVRGVGKEDDLGVSILDRLQKSMVDSCPMRTRIPCFFHSAATPITAGSLVGLGVWTSWFILCVRAI